MLSFHVGRFTAYQVFHATQKGLMKVLILPGLTQTAKELEELSLGFKKSHKRLDPLTSYVGAIDGISIRIKKPSCSNAAPFYCREGSYSLPFQALVDSKYHFLDVFIRCVGSTHDRLAHSVSQLGQYLATKRLRIEYWIAGDEAYLCNNSLICPIPLSHTKSCWENGFTFYLSSLRIHVEQAFWMLVARWRVLRDLEFSVEVSSEIVALCMKLHNFCVENKPEQMENINADDVCQSNKNVLAWYDCCKERMASWVNAEELELEGEEVVLTKRDELFDVIKKKGLTRPLPPGVPFRAAEL